MKKSFRTEEVRGGQGPRDQRECKSLGDVREEDER